MGKFGLLHKGRCDETLDKVTILSVLKTRFAVDFDILQRSQTHNNVIKYFCHEEKPNFGNLKHTTLMVSLNLRNLRLNYSPTGSSQLNLQTAY